MDGTAFGRYTLLNLLGRGGMGDVWRAYDTETSRIVAVKVLPEHLAHDPVFEERFRREALAAAGLTDPHVVPIHSFGEINGRLYVDMRLINGRDLKSLLDGGPLPPARAVKIIEQVASALDSAHAIGLVHRDVKPSNILVAERDFAYLIDFGIARAAHETSLTSTGATIGTFAYMAPERFRSGAADKTADVYALACVLYEALTGRQPYPGSTLEAQVTAHLMQPPPRPSQTNPTVPLTLDRVVAVGMAKNPAQRFATTGALADAAEQAITAPAPPTMPAPRFASPPPLPAPPVPQYAPHPGNPKSPLWKRKTILIPALAACTVLVVATSFVLFAGGDDESDPVQARTTSTSPRTTTSSAGTYVPDAGGDIDRLLLSPGEIDSIMGTTGLNGPVDSAVPPGVDTAVSPPECDSLVDAVSPADIRSSGFTAMRAQSLEGDTPAFAIQAVFEYINYAAAMDVKSSLTAAWKSCSGKDVRSSQFQYKVRDVIDAAGTLSGVYDVPDIGVSCSNVLAVSFVYVIRTSVCKQGVTNEAHAIADQIAERI